MPAAKSRNHDESHPKEKNGGPTSTKMRRGASQQSHQAAAPMPAPTLAQVKEAEPVAPTIQWPSFDRDVLHTYRRQHHLATPACFAVSYHHTVLSQPSGIGIYSPTMVRKRNAKRQVKDQLAMAVRKHFNGVGIQENDVIVDFLHKIQTENASKPKNSGQATLVAE